MNTNPERTLGKGMLFIAWLLVLVIATYFFSGWERHKENPNQNPTGYYAPSGDYVLEIARNHYGHYVVNGAINGYSVTFMFDTGATDVVIPEPIAKQIGLKRGAPSYAQTANGEIVVYLTQLNEIKIGEITLTKIRASINPHMDGDTILLGMSALKQLRISQENNSLYLRLNQ